MKIGDLVLAPFEIADREPQMYRIDRITRGKANLRRVNITDGVMAPEQREVPIYDLRSWRALTTDQFGPLQDDVTQLRMQRAAVRDRIKSLPLVADTE